MLFGGGGGGVEVIEICHEGGGGLKNFQLPPPSILFNGIALKDLMYSP